MRTVNLPYLNSVPYRALACVSSIDYSEALGPKAAALLRARECELALVPTGAFHSIDDIQLLPFGIAADGFVGSVTLFSEVPTVELEEVLLDEDSRTSSLLLSVLLKDLGLEGVRTRREPPEQIPHLIRARTGGLIIGDNALRNSGSFAFEVDLPELWKKRTGYPVVFAAWATRGKSQSELDEISRILDDALRAPLPTLEPLSESLGIPTKTISEYLCHRIQYRISPEAWKGAEILLQRAQSLG